MHSGSYDVFDKVFDEIKYFCKVVTAGSKEARQMEKVKKIFMEAYRQEVKSSDDGDVKYKLTQNPSNPNFTSDEWSIVNRKKHSEFYNPKYDLDETNKWLYSNKNGNPIFAVYSTNDPDDPTVLYGSRGKKAERDYAKLLEWQERSGKSAEQNWAALDRLLSAVKSEKGNTGDGLYSVGGRGTTAGDVPVHLREQGSFGRGDFVDGSQNLKAELNENDVGAIDSEIAPVTFSNDYLDRSEFKCTCGGRGCSGYPEEPSERLVRNADQTRKHFGKPCIVSSGVRCKLRNSELPGSASNSLHMRGKAMDFCIQGLSANQVLAYIKTLPEVDEAYAIDSSFVHMGVQKYQ